VAGGWQLICGWWFEVGGLRLVAAFLDLVCWQNSVVIFENSYIPHLTSFLAEIWSVYRPLNQESTKI